MIWKNILPFCVALVVAGAAEPDPKRLAAEMIAGKDRFAFPAAAGKYSSVFRGIQGKSGFDLYSYLIHHEERFWAIWSSAPKRKDPDQQVLYSTSRDGHDWTAPKVLAADPDGPQGPARWIARGLFLQDGKLSALAAYQESADYGKRGRDIVWKNLRLIYFQWESGAWKQKGVFADDCMNNFPPARFGSRMAMICRDRNMDVSVALLDDAAKLPGSARRLKAISF